MNTEFSMSITTGKIDTVVRKSSQAKRKKRHKTETKKSHEIWSRQLRIIFLRKAQQHTQTISDIVDSRRGGHEGQSLDGRKLPVGLKSS
jgi:hypothetical protein